MKPFVSIPRAISELREGKMLVVVDNPNRENQGDLIFPAELATDAKVNFMLSECRGMICAPITQKTAVQLSLPLMIESIQNTEKTRVNFTDSVDAKSVADFGISAADRALTIKTIAQKKTKPTDLVRPGHVFPLIAQEGGVLARLGHTEATIELVKCAGFSPCGVLCEILNRDGSIARRAELTLFAKKHTISLVSTLDLLLYVQKHPSQVKPTPIVIRQSKARLPTVYGEFEMSVYRSIADKREHTLLRMGKPSSKGVLTRIHSQCFTGDTLSSLKCDCRQQLEKSMELIAKEGNGVIVYLNQEGRGIGLSHKIAAYALQETGLDTVEANLSLGFPPDARDFRIAVDMLRDCGISSICLLTNNPKKEQQVEQYGIRVEKIVPLEIPPTPITHRYLQTKKRKLGHRLTGI